MAIAAMCVIAAIGGAVSLALAERLAATHSSGQWALFAKSEAMPLHLVQLAPSASPLLATLLTFALLGALGWWLAGFVKAHDARGGRTIAVAFSAIALVLLFAPVVYSLDVFLYDVYGLLYGRHGINPYDLFPLIGHPLNVDDAALTQLYPIVKNPPFSDPYGPLWTLLAAAVGAATGGAPVIVQLLAFRLLSIAAAGCAIAALWRLLRNVPAGERALRVARFAFNPLVLYECCVGAHNDILMVAPALWAFVLVDELPLVAGLLAGAAIAVKIVALAVLPFLIVAAARRGVLKAVALAGLALIVPLSLKRLFAFDADAGGSLLAVGSGLSMSINWLLALPFINAHLLNAPVSSDLPWIPMVGPPTWGRLLQVAMLAIVIGAIGACVARFLRTRSLSAIAPATLALVLSVPAMHPWYGLWQAPFVAARGLWGTFSAWFCGLLLVVYVHEAVMPGAWSRPLWLVITLAYLAIPAIAARLTRAPAERPVGEPTVGQPSPI